MNAVNSYLLQTAILNPMTNTLPFTSYVDLGKLVNFFVTKFMLLKLNEIIHIK